ncbi:EthD family reductase [Agrococcus versicolor]|uniref:EthD family reductase n=1 Tax=Agrococcus versicolor TaxID=501482 RepID=A0ABP5MBP8_9MICO
MHRLLVLYPTPVDPAAFREHYVARHLPLADRLPGMLASRYSLDVHDEVGGYFAVFEADFADAGAMQAAMASPEGQAVAADVPRYATGGAIVLDFPVVER